MTERHYPAVICHDHPKLKRLLDQIPDTKLSGALSDEIERSLVRAEEEAFERGLDSEVYW